MKGRIYTFQDHPYEGPTNYIGLACLRCNLDVQDLRRVLVDYAPASLPSTGPKEHWSWMSVDAPISDFDIVSCDWAQVYDELIDMEEKAGTAISIHAASIMLIWVRARRVLANNAAFSPVDCVGFFAAELSIVVKLVFALHFLSRCAGVFATELFQRCGAGVFAIKRIQRFPAAQICHKENPKMPQRQSQDG